jgi:hypothetical protein
MTDEAVELRDLLNEYGTPVSVHVCSGCGTDFTVCPAATGEHADHWDEDGCLGVGCSTYDPSRDIDALWDQMQQRGHIQQETEPTR